MFRLKGPAVEQTTRRSEPLTGLLQQGAMGGAAGQGICVAEAPPGGQELTRGDRPEVGVGAFCDRRPGSDVI